MDRATCHLDLEGVGTPVDRLERGGFETSASLT
jgi:hypothetical protein